MEILGYGYGQNCAHITADESGPGVLPSRVNDHNNDH